MCRCTDRRSLPWLRTRRARHVGELGDRHVEGERLQQQQAVGLAVLGEQADAEGDGVSGLADPCRLAEHGDLAVVDRVGAEDRPQHLGATGAGEAGDGEDLTGANVQVDVGDDAGAGEAANGECLGARVGRLAVDLGQHVATDHQPHECAGGQVRGPLRGDDVPVLHHGHPVGDLEDLAEAVGDVDERRALGGEPADDVEQALQLGVAEHRRRLVEDDQAGVA